MADAVADGCFPGNLFPVPLAVALFYSRSPECPVGIPVAVCRITKLQAARVAYIRSGSAHVRVFLGIVEFLFFSEVDLYNSLSGHSTHFRDAIGGLWRVYSVWLGTVCDPCVRFRNLRSIAI